MQNKLEVLKPHKTNITYCLTFVLLGIPVTSYADFSFANYHYTLTNLHANNLVDTDSYYTINFTPVQTDGTINTYEYINNVWTPVSYIYTVTPNTGVVESTEIIRNYNTSDITGYFHNLTSSEITAPDPLMYGFINVIAGDFVGNTQEYKAGALTNSGFTINNIYGDFINNLSVGGVNGAAITNRNNGNIQNIIGNFVNNESLSQGGAIVNDESTITNITANFINNFVSGEDILITNSTQSSNSVQYGAGDSFGGAIYNTGNITTISGDFISNNVNSYKYFDGLNTHGGTNAIGGAILNGLFMNVPVDYSTNVASIDTILGQFVGNSATVTNAIAIDTLPYTGTIRAYGGAISNSYVYGHNWAGIIQSIQADFNNNFVEISNESSISVNDTLNINAYGGAIYNYFFTPANNSGLIDSINGNFVNNKALINNSGNITTADVIFNASGGAIYNNGHINNVNGDFISNNITINNTGEISTTDVAFNALGGAIYNYSGQINVSGNFVNNSVVINANTANVTSNAFGGAIYNGPGQINLNATNNNILFSGNSADSGGAIYNATYGFITMNISENRDITFATTSDDIHNDGTVTVSGDGNLYLQSVSGVGTFIVKNTGTYLSETATMTQGSLKLYDGGVLYANANSLNVSSIVNGGELHLTGGTLSSNISWQNTSYGGGYSSDFQRIYIEGDVLNEGVIAQNSLLNGLVITSGNSFTTNTNNIGVDIVNYGEVILTGGTLVTNISGGDITINGTVNSVAGLLSTNNAITNNGTLNITGGNLQQNVSGGNTIIAQNATTSATNFGNLELNGVMNVGTNTVNMANADINGTINLGISALNKNSSAYTGGHIIANDITFGDNAKLSLTITDTNLQKGDSTGDLSIITANGTWTGDFDMLTSNNLYDIAYNDNNHTFTFTRKKLGADLITENNGSELDVNVATVWDELQSSNNHNVQSIINAIDYNSQHNAKKYATLIHNLAPHNNQVTVGAIRNVNTAINNRVTARLATLRPQPNNNARMPYQRFDNKFYYAPNYGRSGGDVAPVTNNGLWVEGLYNYAQQKDDTKFSGKTYGVTGGFDSKLTEHLTAGLGYAFNKTTIDADNHDIDATGHTGFIYAEYKPAQWYLDALLSYNITNYQDSSVLVDNLSVNSDYKTNSFGGSVISGYDFQKGYDLYGGLNYIGIKQDAYTDTAGQKIKADDTQTLTLTAGGKYRMTSQNMKKASTILKAAVLYDVMSDDGVTTVTVGNNNYIVRGNGIDPFGVQAGIMFDALGNNANLSIGYDLEWRNNFISHTGYIKLKYNF